MIDLEVLVDPRWVELPVQQCQEAGEWAEAAVAEALALRRVVEEPRIERLMVQTYAATLDALRDRAPQDGLQLVGAYALVSPEDMLPVTVAELAVHRLESGQTADHFVDALVVEPSQRFAAPDVRELATAFGTAVRVQQLRVVDEGQDAPPSVQTSVVHVWPGPMDHLVTTLSAWFGSPVDAETSRTVLEELAVSLRRRPQ